MFIYIVTKVTQTKQYKQKKSETEINTLIYSI